MMKTIKSIILFLLISASVYAQDSLNSYLKIAAENNAELKMHFNDYLASLERVPQAKALPDPQLAFAYFIQPIETRVGPQQIKLSASQMFPWFGTFESKEQVAAMLAKAKYEKFLERKSNLFNEVRSSYFNLYFNQKGIDITIENLDLLNTIKKMVNVKIETGSSSALDQYRLEMELADLNNQLALLKDQKQVLTVQFKNLLNDFDNNYDYNFNHLSELEMEFSKQEILDSIQINNHRLLILALQQNALNYKKSVSENMGKPSFSIGLDYTVVGKGENNLAGTDAFLFPKVGISIPLYRSKYKAMVNEVMYEQKAKAFEQENQENLLKVIFEKTWKNLLDANRRIILYKTQTELAQQSLELLETEYATGSVAFEEILRMDRKLLTYNLEYQKATTDKQAAIAFIYYLMGR